MKLLDLNIWNYNDFDRRMGLIVGFIKRHSPDIITFQEARDDPRYNSPGNNQAKQISDAVGYNHVFMKIMDKKIEDVSVIEGLAILSKEPIIIVSEKMLKRQPCDCYSRGILHTRINGQDIINVHFSPDDEFARLHLLETLEYVRRGRIRPVIAGDFNFRDSSVMDAIDFSGYKISSKFKDYISKPPYNLDYILIPNNLDFVSLECIDAGMSDHRAILAEIG